MALVTVGGLPVVSGVVWLPRVGIWTAQVHLDSEAPLGASLTTAQAAATSYPEALTFGLGAGSMTLQGAVSLGDTYAGSTYARIVGGTNGLQRRATAKNYRNAPASLVLTELLTACGEKLSATSTTSVTSTILQYWEITAQPAASNIRALAEALGASWRFLPDGSLWLGVETWPASTLASGQFTVTRKSPQHGFEEVATDVMSLLPGQVFDSQRVNAVEYTFGEAVRTKIWFE